MNYLDTTPRDRSYRNRLQRGDRVLLIEDCYRGSPLKAGMEGTVLSESNAGFRGIEASVRFDSGQTAHSISTGILHLQHERRA